MESARRGPLVITTARERREFVGLADYRVYLRDRTACLTTKIGEVRDLKMEIGTSLLQAEAWAEHGEWLAFYETIGINKRTAQSAVDLARKVGDGMGGFDWAKVRELQARAISAKAHRGALVERPAEELSLSQIENLTGGRRDERYRLDPRELSDEPIEGELIEGGLSDGEDDPADLAEEEEGQVSGMTLSDSVTQSLSHSATPSAVAAANGRPEQLHLSAVYERAAETRRATVARLGAIDIGAMDERKAASFVKWMESVARGADEFEGKGLRLTAG